MDSRELRENFVKIYEGEEKGVRAFSVCPSVRLCGINADGFDCAAIAVSPDTVTVIRPTDGNDFKIIKSNNDVMYSCRNDLLKQCNEPESVKRLFETVGMMKGSISGADILFVNSVDDTDFQTDIFSLSAAMSMISKNRLPSVEEMGILTHNPRLIDSVTESLLFSRKNCVLFKHKDGFYENVTLYLSDCKLIVFKIMAVKENISAQIKTAALKIKDSTRTAAAERYEEYCLHEQERSECLFRELKNNPLPTYTAARIIRDSSYELFSLCGRYGASLRSIYSAAERVGNACFIAAAYDLGGICAAVKNEYVDGFIKDVSDLYEKREGSKPDIYICDSADSGVELNLGDITVTL